MAHITNLNSSTFTTLAFTGETRAGADVARAVTTRPATPAAWRTLFTGTTNSDTDSDGDRVLVTNVREFPSLGTPANIVNVPVYGQSISSQVGGQADAPTLEFTVNYTPSDHAVLDNMRINGTQVAWRVRLAGSESAEAGGVGESYDDFYFLGTVQSLEVTPALNDATQATFAVSINGDFAGPYSAETSETDANYGLPS